MIGRFLFLLLASAAGLSGAFAADRPLVIDAAQSRCEIAVKATVDSFTGTLAHFAPEVRVNDEGRISAARLTFHFRDVLTGKASRDKAMHTWQNTDAHPDGTFELSAIETAPEGTSTAFGRLTLHGVTRDLRFPVTLTRAANIYAIQGDAPVDVREFGLPVIRMLGVLKVDPVVHVRFHVQGHPAP